MIKEKLNILLVTQYFHPEPFFANTFLVKALISKGHSVEVLTSLPNYPNGKFYVGYKNGLPRKETIFDAVVHRVLTFPRGENNISLAINYLVFAIFASIKALTGSFKRPDIIFLTQFSPIYMALAAIALKKRFSVPLVYWVQDIWPESVISTLNIRNKLICKFLTSSSSILYKKADFLLVQNAAMINMIERFGIASELIDILPNTVSSDYRPINPKKEFKYAHLFPLTGFKIMFAGNIGKAQGFDTLLKAALKLSKIGIEVHWIIAGNGSDLKRLKFEVSRLELKHLFHFIGSHPQEEMSFYFAHADAMLVMLKKNKIFSMTVPCKLQGYFAAGKPVLGSIDGETARIIEESGSGYASPAEDPESLVEIIKKMINDFIDKRTLYEKASLNYFKNNYSEEFVARKLENILLKIVNLRN
tara:strand:- start:1357 stop:2607 length:1251 start_codon:yes stop_codon:yes gene_type:complete